MPKAIEVKAIHLGQKLRIKEFLEKYKYRLTSKEPYILSYAKNKHITLYRYGVIVFWGFKESDINDFLGQISPFISGPMPEEHSETMDIKISRHNLELIDGVLHLKNVQLDQIKLISEILSRSTILEYFEIQVETIMTEFGEVIDTFSNTGSTNLSSRQLLKKVGTAMKIQHMTVSQMAILDKPDLTWDDQILSDFYHQLTEEYEIDDRYSILSEKLKILFHDVEFIVNYIEGRRATVLEIIIIALILVEVVLFVIELGWL